MDFSLNEEEKMLQQAAKEFALNMVLPLAAEIDRTDEFPFGLAQEMAHRGYRGLPFPCQYGGAGAGYLAYALALEQICYASMTVGAIMAVNTVPEEAILRFGSASQKGQLLVPLAKGEKLGCIAFTEAETGSDPSAITTTARPKGSDFLLNGEKHFVALAPAANLALVFARDDEGGLDAFVVDTSSPGYQVKERYETGGLRGLGTSVVYLEDVAVPRKNMLGKKGRGFEVLLEAISLGRLGVAVEGVGVGQAALDQAIEYARQRKALGKPIAELSTIKWLLAEMATRVEAGRWLTYRTAFQRDQGASIRHESSVAKLFASQMAVEVTRMAMQVHGSYGTVKGMTVERLYRDAKVAEIYVGISEIQRVLIANNLLK
jgi:butyryl-CoA dehydrogenase